MSSTEDLTPDELRERIKELEQLLKEDEKTIDELILARCECTPEVCDFAQPFDTLASLASDLLYELSHPNPDETSLKMVRNAIREQLRQVGWKG